MDAVFKLSFGLVVVALLIAVRPVVKALGRRPGGRINQMDHEHPALRVVRPALGLVFYGALLDWLLPGTRLAWALLPIPPVLRWCAVGVCLASVAVLGASFRALGPNYRGGLGLWDDHALVVTGPYSVVRHPIYGAFMLLMLGLWALSESWLLGLSGLLLTAAVPAIRLPIEERELRDRFGRAYRAYEASTPRFLPRPF